MMMMMINALPFVSLCTAYPFISLLFIHLFDGVPFDYRFDFLHIFLENMPNLFFRIYFFPFLPFASILNNTLNFHLAIISCFSGVGPNVKHVSSLIWRLAIAINNDIYIQYIGPLPPKQSLVWYIYIYIYLIRSRGGLLIPVDRIVALITKNHLFLSFCRRLRSLDSQFSIQPGGSAMQQPHGEKASWLLTRIASLNVIILLAFPLLYNKAAKWLKILSLTQYRQIMDQPNPRVNCTPSVKRRKRPWTISNAARREQRTPES